MRGFLQPARKLNPSESQSAFAALSRHRRAKLSKEAQTTLVKAAQWARGLSVTPEVASALEAAVRKLQSKKPR